jgi:hypothetical protein
MFFRTTRKKDAGDGQRYSKGRRDDEKFENRLEIDRDRCDGGIAAIAYGRGASDGNFARHGRRLDIASAGARSAGSARRY